ncbi:hypothetical protein C8A00DRAFT_43963 [Chaetomidium leptoderma]|uniref:Uncharacterized protein n=1 Tax=Chaetomidium leptoderma TaxID=669021 RepID=A0AAN6ZY28_9PEZI|nr:hypothetical protein C8A00DRAFT_43963 [Chaetomidium leptoderma]
MNIESNPKNPRMRDSVPAPWRWISEVPEIPISSLCSVVTWQYTVQNEAVPGHHGAGDAAEAFLFRPSPGLMLVSCLVFGCCVSSFAHRRQSQDPFQIVVYLALLGGAALTGYAVQANVHLILLGYLPWATCAAMVFSISGHSVYRCLKSDAAKGRGDDEEKARLLG